MKEASANFILTALDSEHVCVCVCVCVCVIDVKMIRVCGSLPLTCCLRSIPTTEQRVRVSASLELVWPRHLAVVWHIHISTALGYELHDETSQG